MSDNKSSAFNQLEEEAKIEWWRANEEDGFDV